MALILKDLFNSPVPPANFVFPVKQASREERRKAELMQKVRESNKKVFVKMNRKRVVPNQVIQKTSNSVDKLIQKIKDVQDELVTAALDDSDILQEYQDQ